MASKYGAIREGKYASKREAKVAMELHLRQRARRRYEEAEITAGRMFRSNKELGKYAGRAMWNASRAAGRVGDDN